MMKIESQERRWGYELGPRLDQGEGETDEVWDKGVRVHGWFGQR